MATTTPTPNVLVTIEKDVEAFIAKVVSGVEHVIADVVQALSNVAKLMPAATQKIEALAPFIESLGVEAGHPEIAAGVAAANVAMEGLNKFMQTFNQATNGGGVTATQAKAAITDAYQAYRDVGATYNAVKSSAVKIATTPPAPAPIVTQ